jgi:hypothetical protein
MNDLQFEESQQFRNRSFWIFLGTLLLFLITLFGYGFIKQIILGQPFGTKPASDSGIILTTAFVYLLCAGLFLLFFFAKLTTIINKDGVFIKYVPFRNRKKHIPLNEIESLHVRKYDPIREYGGFGLRFGFKGGMAYNVSGFWGLQIIMKDGEKILIGTQKPEELNNFLKNINPVSSNN